MQNFMKQVMTNDICITVVKYIEHSCPDERNVSLNNSMSKHLYKCIKQAVI